MAEALRQKTGGSGFDL